MLKTDELLFEDAVLDQHIHIAKNDKPSGHFSLVGVDALVGGIHSGRMTIIAGQPGVSKTTLLDQLACDAAMQGFVVVVNTLEVAVPQFISKSIARLSNGRITVNDMAAGDKEDEVNELIELYRNRIAPNLCFIDRACTAVGLSVAVSKIQRMREEQVVLFQDYLQIMPSASDQRFIDERLVVKEAASGLRHIANTHNVPVFAISSVNRATYGKSSASLDSLGACSAIEYSADSVLYLSVEGSGKERDENMNKVIRPLILTALKHRYAPTGSVSLLLDTEHATFTER